MRVIDGMVAVEVAGIETGDGMGTAAGEGKYKNFPGTLKVFDLKRCNLMLRLTLPYLVMSR